MQSFLRGFQGLEKNEYFSSISTAYVFFLITFAVLLFLFASLAWAACAIGLWVYSNFRKIEVEFVEGEIPSGEFPPDAEEA